MEGSSPTPLLVFGLGSKAYGFAILFTVPANQRRYAAFMANGCITISPRYPFSSL
jgi:hypothetical protein